MRFIVSNEGLYRRYEFRTAAGLVMATCRTRPHADDHRCIVDLFVPLRFRNRGLAQMLLKRVMVHERGKHAIVPEAYDRHGLSTQELRRLYMKLGFKECGEEMRKAAQAAMAGPGRCLTECELRGWGVSPEEGRRRSRVVDPAPRGSTQKDWEAEKQAACASDIGAALWRV